MPEDDDEPLIANSRSSSPPLIMFGIRFGNTAQRRTMDPARRRKLLFSYLPDWILTIVLAAGFFALNKVDGFKRSFSVDDTSLRHTYALHERVPDIALYFIAVLTPFVLQTLINLFTVWSWWDFHNSTLGLILGLALTGSVTQLVKVTVGRPRPDVLARCLPQPGSVDPQYGLSTVAICTQMDKSILKDGFRSFPSGHSSLSFAGLGFLTFYLAGKLHLFDHRGHAGKAWLSLSPLVAAALVGISRTMDYRHHWHDVLVGSVLGLTLAYFTYRQYYPSLASEYAHRPYSPRIRSDRAQELLPTHFNHDAGDAQNRTSHRTHGSTSRPFRDDPGHDEVELEGGALAGTVSRPEPGHMKDAWSEHEPEREGEGTLLSTAETQRNAHH